jgi:hypothetical protein
MDNVFPEPSGALVVGIVVQQQGGDLAPPEGLDRQLWSIGGSIALAPLLSELLENRARILRYRRRNEARHVIRHVVGGPVR